MLLVAVVDQRVQPLDRLGDDVATLAAVPAVRPAELDELLAAERHAAVTTVAGADIDLGLVEKLHGAATGQRGRAVAPLIYKQPTGLGRMPPRMNPTTTPSRAALAGIARMIAGIFLFAVNDALGKWLVATYTVGQVLLIRSLAALVVLTPFIWRDVASFAAAPPKTRLPAAES